MADAIAKPDVPLALRTSGHLLLGVVRIYERKIRYLLVDCGEALQKIQLAYRPGLDSAEKKDREEAAEDGTYVAPDSAITLDDTAMGLMEEDDFTMGAEPASECVATLTRP